ncbi:MAG TPA: ATP-binding protein [bacterium]|nr:ATP-binding protein [bacterium]
MDEMQEIAEYQRRLEAERVRRGLTPEGRQGTVATLSQVMQSGQLPSSGSGKGQQVARTLPALDSPEWSEPPEASDCSRCGAVGLPWVKRLVPREVSPSGWVWAPGPCLLCTRRAEEEGRAAAKDRIDASLRRSLEASGLPQAAWDLSVLELAGVEAWEGNALAVEALAELGRGSIVLWGERGRGKTHLAMARCADFVRDGVGVLMLVEPQFFHLARLFEGRKSSRDIVAEATAVDVLLLDNLGALERMTPFARDAMVEVVLTRHQEGRTTILTMVAAPWHQDGSGEPWLACHFGGDVHARVDSWPAYEITGADLRRRERH